MPALAGGCLHRMRVSISSGISAMEFNTREGQPIDDGYTLPAFGQLLVFSLECGYVNGIGKRESGLAGWMSRPSLCHAKGGGCLRSP